MSRESSPQSDVVDRLILGSSMPYAMNSPNRRARARRSEAANASPLQGRSWRGPVHNGPDRSPWHASRIVPIIRDALAPSATIEALLRATNSVFLCASESDENRNTLRAMQSLTSLLAHLYERSDSDSHSGARIKEHTINTLTVLLGADTDFDELVTYDPDWLPNLIPRALLDRHAAVVLAASRFIRRLTEAGADIGGGDEGLAAAVGGPFARQVVLSDELFESLLRRYERCEDVPIRVNLLCALSNAASDSRIHFCMARCQRLLQLLLDEVFNGGIVGAQVTAAQWDAGFAGASQGLARSESGTTPSGKAPATPMRSPSATSTAVAKRRAMRPALTDVSPLRRFVSSTTPGRGEPASPSTPGRPSVATSLRPAGGPRHVANHHHHHHHHAATAGARGTSIVSSDNIAAAADPATNGALDVCELALRCFDRLLSSEEQCAEIKRLAPSIVQAVVDCRGSPSEGVTAAATSVLRKLHDLDSLAVEQEMSIEVMRGRATTNRLRSRPSDAVMAAGVPGAESMSDEDVDDRYSAPLPSNGGAHSARLVDIPSRVGPSTASTVFSARSSALETADNAGSGADEDFSEHHATKHLGDFDGGGSAAGAGGSAVGSNQGSALDLVRHMLGY